MFFHFVMLFLFQFRFGFGLVLAPNRSCFEWESPIRSTIAFILWVCGCIFADLSTIPAILMIIMLKYVLTHIGNGCVYRNLPHVNSHKTDGINFVKLEIGSCDGLRAHRPNLPTMKSTMVAMTKMKKTRTGRRRRP